MRPYTALQEWSANQDPLNLHNPPETGKGTGRRVRKYTSVSAHEKSIQCASEAPVQLVRATGPSKTCFGGKNALTGGTPGVHFSGFRRLGRVGEGHAIDAKKPVSYLDRLGDHGCSPRCQCRREGSPRADRNPGASLDSPSRIAPIADNSKRFLPARHPAATRHT